MIVGPRHGPALPGELSGSSDKLDLYAADAYFVESWEDLVEVAGDQALSVAGTFAGLTLKPDAIVARVGRQVLRWLDAEGFSIVTAERVVFDRRMLRDVWRYAWNAATRERKDTMDLLMCASPSLFLGLRAPAPAALRLGERKGSADPAKRSSGDLREALGARVPLINFVHTTDEAADAIREIGVCFDAEQRRAIYRAALAPPMELGDVETLLAEIEAMVPSYDLALGPAVRRVVAQLDEIGAEERRELRRQLLRVADGASADWRVIARLLDELRVPCTDWDRVVIASNVVRLETGEFERLLPGVP